MRTGVPVICCGGIGLDGGGFMLSVTALRRASAAQRAASSKPASSMANSMVMSVPRKSRA